ncbi:MAG: D-alanyl-D-alanine carboxypeptidase [Clostridia bacterium]|nr:D-alanyl-D-alanine carboxypeptidase [Clostridia bacterium]
MKTEILKKIIVPIIAFSLIVSAILLYNIPTKVTYAEELSTGKAAYMIDYETGNVIYARNENERLPIASMVKIMTALLTFEEIEKGNLSYDDEIVVSERASSMGGSQIFLDTNAKIKVENLLKSVIISSANDSCVALAERIGGSVEGFVKMMNDKAISLDMQNTHFVNCTGLPAPEGFSSAKDVSIMFKELISYPRYFEFAKIWMEDFVHPNGRVTGMANTNKLIRFYNGCDGGKTGFTSEAKFCLAATAKRNDMRIIAVVIGEESSKTRFKEVSSMFDFAFANCTNELLMSKDEIVANVLVSGGKEKRVGVSLDRDAVVFKMKNEKAFYDINYEINDRVRAPIRQGDIVGTAYVTKDGVVIDIINVVVTKDVKKASLWDYFKRIGNKW